MKFPKTIPVLGKEYKIIITNTFHAAGETDSEASTITIASDGTQSDGELLHTLLHELGHALFRRTGVTQGLAMETEEIIVDQIATLFTELFDIKIKKKATKPL